MILRAFGSVRFKGDWELNFIGQRWPLNLRIGRSQFALWWDDRPLFNLLRRSRGNAEAAK